jgi:hypothetical protein
MGLPPITAVLAWVGAAGNPRWKVEDETIPADWGSWDLGSDEAIIYRAHRCVRTSSVGISGPYSLLGYWKGQCRR